MTEVSSMSEPEGARRPSSLPPPPSERLPRPPAIFISDTEAIQYLHKTKERRKVKKHNTVSGVTLEARRVLEHLLRRSHSHNDAPSQSDSSCGAEPRIGRTDPRLTAHERSGGGAEMTYPNMMERLMKEKMAELSLSESYDNEEPDYVYTHEIGRKPPSVGSHGSGRSSVHMHFHNTSTSTTSATQSPKLPPRCHTPVHITKHSHHHHHHHLDDESSSSTEDYEYTDPNEFQRRKKKSFFRRQTERLMHAFRRRKEHPLDFETESQDMSSPHKLKKKKKSKLMSSSFKNIKSPKVEFESQRRDWLHQEVLRTENSSPDHVTHYTDIEQFHEESIRRKCQSPSLWTRSKFNNRDEHFSDGGKDRSVLGNFIRSIKKRSSFRVKRKPSTKEHRSQSEENIHIRPLTAEERTILRRYDVNVRVAETGSDSDHVTTVRSLREVLSTRIDQQMGPMPLALDEDLVMSAGRRPVGARPRDSVQAPQARTSQFDEHDYDEIDDGDCIDGILSNVADIIPKPFSERTVTEKDQLYERIADQLAAIADHYNFGSSSSRKNSPTELLCTLDLLQQQESSGSSELEGAAAAAAVRTTCSVLRSESKRSKSSEEEVRDVTDIEREFGAALRARGDTAGETHLTDLPLVRNLVHSVSYGDFQQILGEKLGPNPGWQQVAMMFRLTQTAVHLAGLGTHAASRMKENTMKYFEERMASWIVKQGGWESVVEDTNSELD